MNRRRPSRHIIDYLNGLLSHLVWQMHLALSWGWWHKCCNRYWGIVLGCVLMIFWCIATVWRITWCIDSLCLTSWGERSFMVTWKNVSLEWIKWCSWDMLCPPKECSWIKTRLRQLLIGLHLLVCKRWEVSMVLLFCRRLISNFSTSHQLSQAKVICLD